MKANELMIGDWVKCGKRYMKVTQLAEDMDCDDIEPIPLTQEILEKNGWECFDTFHKYNHYRHPKSPFYILHRKDGGYAIEFNASESGGSVFLFILYVHKLQHVLRLCGIEEEITI